MLLGLALRNTGTLGSPAGRSVAAAFNAAWTSRAAPSTLRLKSNSAMMTELPSELTEVSSVSPAISPTWRSIGAATVEPMISGLAPVYCALMKTAGKSIVGRALTGSLKYATAPTRNTPTASRIVPIGRRMKRAEMFIRYSAAFGCRNSSGSSSTGSASLARAKKRARRPSIAT